MRKIEVHSSETSTEWPKDVSGFFQGLVQLGHLDNLGILCAVAINFKTDNLSVQFANSTAQNPDIAELCDAIAEMFTDIAKRMRQ